MKKAWITCSLAALLLLIGCTDRQMMGTYMGGTMGGILGSSIGGLMGGPRGSDAGTLIGMLAGGALGSAVTAPRTEEGGGRAAEERRDYDEVYGHGRDVDEYNRRRPAPSRRVGQLEIRNLRLLDENRDGRIERGERCKLVFTLYNRGNKPVYNLTPLITSDERRIRFSPPATIADLYPGKGVRYTSVVYSDRKLKNGEAHFSIRILQGDREVRLCTFAVPTRR